MSRMGMEINRDSVLEVASPTFLQVALNLVEPGFWVYFLVFVGFFFFFTFLVEMKRICRRASDFPHCQRVRVFGLAHRLNLSTNLLEAKRFSTCGFYLYMYFYIFMIKRNCSCDWLLSWITTHLCRLKLNFINWELGFYFPAWFRVWKKMSCV